VGEVSKSRSLPKTRSENDRTNSRRSRERAKVAPCPIQWALSLALRPVQAAKWPGRGAGKIAARACSSEYRVRYVATVVRVR